MEAFVLAYAGDGVFAFSHPGEDETVGAALRLAGDAGAALGKLGLPLSGPKSFDMIISPGLNLRDTFFGGGAAGSAFKWEEERRNWFLARTLEVPAPRGVIPMGPMSRLPFFWANSLKALGLGGDLQFDF